MPRDPVKHLKNQKKYYLNNTDKVLKYNKKYRKEHKEETKVWNKKYYKEHEEELKEYTRNRTMKTRKKLIKILGGKCVKCNIKDYIVLQIDHIANDGKLKRKERDTISWYAFYIKNIIQAKKEIQLLCANCHVKKTKRYMRQFWRDN